MGEYGWEIAERLEEGVEDDDISEVASAISSLERSRGLSDERAMTLFLAREYARRNQYEGIQRWTEEIYESKSSYGFFPVLGSYTGSAVGGLLSYNLVVNQDFSIVPPSDFGAVASGLVGGITFLGALNYLEPRDFTSFEEELSRLDSKFGASPELESLRDQIYG